MEKRKGKLWIKLGFAALTIALCASFFMVIASSMGVGIVIEPMIYDHAEIIQSALNDAAKSGQPLEFSNPGGNTVYKVGKSLIIPDGVTINGNGATILIDETIPFNAEKGKAFTRGGVSGGIYFPYNEFAILSEGMATGNTTTFTIDNLNFVMNTTSSSTDIPKTLFGIRHAKDVTITNCSFSVYSTSQRGLSAFDAYSNWNNLTLSGCTFNVMTDGPQGGVWLRNIGSSSVSSDALIENCTFTKRGGEEILAIWGNSKGWVKNVTVRGCSFYSERSQYNNPVHLLSASTSTDNILFDNNIIYAQALNQSLFLLTSPEANGKMYVRNNEAVIDDLFGSRYYLINGGGKTEAVYVENNSFTVNSSSGVKKDGIYAATLVSGNKFYGNGLSYITCAVKDVYNNEVEQCVNGFEYVVNCVGNTIHSASNLAIIPSAASSPTTRQILIKDNNITAAKSSNCMIYTMPETPYINIVFENNVLVGTRIYMMLSGGDVELVDNDFHVSTLNHIFTNGRTTLMSGNGFYDLSTGKSLISSYPPTQYEFCISVPVGSFVGLSDESVYDTNVMGPDKNGELIGYVKIAKGNSAASWTPIYSLGAQTTKIAALSAFSALDTEVAPDEADVPEFNEPMPAYEQTPIEESGEQLIDYTPGEQETAYEQPALNDLDTPDAPIPTP